MGYRMSTSLPSVCIGLAKALSGLVTFCSHVAIYVLHLDNSSVGLVEKLSLLSDEHHLASCDTTTALGRNACRYLCDNCAA